MSWHRLFFWILLLFLPTQLGYHVWPDWAMVLGRRVDYLAPTLYLTDILVLLTVGAYIIFNFQFSIFNQFSKRLFLLLFFILCNIFFSADESVAIYKWIKVAEFVALGWYIVKTKPRLSTVIVPLSVGVLYSSVLAVAQFFLQHSVGGPLWFLGERAFMIDTPGIARYDFQFSIFNFQFSIFGLRPYATFPHPNVLGGYLAAILPLVIIQLSNNQIFKLSNMNKQKIFYFVTLILGMITLVLTFSRSAIVVGVIGILLAFRKKMLSIVIVLGVIFFFILNSQFSILNSHDESVVVRQQLNVAAIHMWQQSLVFGVGLGNFLVELPKSLPSRSVYFLQPVHNIYLLLLAELGIVGFLFILLTIFLVVKREWRMKNIEFRKNILSFSILYSLFSILLLGLIDHYSLTLQQGQLLLTLFVSLNLVANPRKIDT